MNERQHYKEILKSLSRELLEDEMADILILLFNRMEDYDVYNRGWNDSRKSIIKICNLEKYRFNEKL